MKTPTVAIVGSRALPQGQAPRLLISFLAGLAPGSKVLLRRGLFTSPNLFEVQVEQLCDLIGIEMEWRYPEFSAKGLGRQAVFHRDEKMAEESDLVLAFYDESQIGDERSGTVAFIDKAVRLNTPCYAYALRWVYDEPLPAVIRVGEHDPKNLWADKVPAA